jgi:anti-sigma factor RsiW
MNCRRCQDALHAYLDHELGAPASVLLKAHLQACPACRQALETLQALRTQLRRPELRVTAPAGFRQQIQGRLKAEREMAVGQINPGRRRPAWIRAAATVAVVMGLGLLWFAPPWGGPGASERGLARVVVALHLQSLAPEPPLGIRSSNLTAVRSWLAEQVGFVVPVENPTGEGFSLDGARAAQVGQQKAAVLIYRCEGHVITLFIWPRPTPPRPEEALYAEGGYRVIHWDQGTLTCWAVSDLSAQALHRFCDALGG